MKTPTTPIVPIKPVRLADLIASIAAKAPPIAPLPSARPASDISNGERELAWYFGFADSEMGRRSNLRITAEAAAGRTWGAGIHEIDDDGLERRVNASHAARRIERRLESLSGMCFGVLMAAYEPVAWPRSFLERYGKLAGVVARIVAATYGHGVDDGHGRRLGERIARRNEQGRETDDGWEELAAAHEQARFLYKEARAAYDRVRGGVDAASIVPEGER